MARRSPHGPPLTPWPAGSRTPLADLRSRACAQTAAPAAACAHKSGQPPGRGLIVRGKRRRGSGFSTRWPGRPGRPGRGGGLRTQSAGPGPGSARGPRAGLAWEIRPARWTLGSPSARGLRRYHREHWPRQHRARQHRTSQHRTRQHRTRQHRGPAGGGQPLVPGSGRPPAPDWLARHRARGLRQWRSAEHLPWRRRFSAPTGQLIVFGSAASPSAARPAVAAQLASKARPSAAGLRGGAV